MVLLTAAAFFVLTYGHDVLKMVVHRQDKFSDFGNYCYFAHEFRSGTNIYKLADQDLSKRMAEAGIDWRVTGYAEYSPFFYVCMRPFVAMPHWPATVLWLLVGHLALGLAILLSGLLVRERCGDRVTLIALLGLAFFASQPLIEGVALGQINMITIALMVGLAYLEERKPSRPFSGALLASVLLIQPQFGVFWLYFLLRRRYATCLCTVAVYAAFRIAGAMACGWDMELGYWQHMLDCLTKRYRVMEIGLSEMFRRLLDGRAPGWAAQACFSATALLFCAITGIRIWRARSEDSLMEFCAVAALMLLASPVAEEHHLTYLNLSFVVGFVALRRSWPAMLAMVAAFLLVNVGYSLVSFRQFDSGPLAILAFGKMAGVLILWVTLLWGLSLRRRADAVQTGAVGAAAK